MANNQTSANTEATVCKKIHNAIRHISHCPQSSKPTTTAEVNTSAEVPIDFNNEMVPTRVAVVLEKPKPMAKAKAAVGSVAEVASKKREPAAPPEEGKSSVTSDNGNDNFSNYINRAKAKIRATSNVHGGGGGGGGKKSGLRLDSFNDKVTKYIKRAKIKLRSTTMSR